MVIVGHSRCGKKSGLMLTNSGPACLCKTSEGHLDDSRAKPHNSVCVFFFTHQATLHQPRTLPIARHVILSWVESFL